MKKLQVMFFLILFAITALFSTANAEDYTFSTKEEIRRFLFGASNFQDFNRKVDYDVCVKSVLNSLFHSARIAVGNFITQIDVSTEKDIKTGRVEFFIYVYYSDSKNPVSFPSCAET